MTTNLKEFQHIIFYYQQENEMYRKNLTIAEVVNDAFLHVS